MHDAHNSQTANGVPNKWFLDRPILQSHFSFKRNHENYIKIKRFITNNCCVQFYFRGKHTTGITAFYDFAQRPLTKSDRCSNLLLLTHTMTAPFSLFVIVWVEINVVQYNVVSSCQVDAQTASFGWQQKNKQIGRRIVLVDQFLSKKLLSF